MTGHTKSPWEAVRRMDEEGVSYWLVQTVAQSGGWELAEVRMDVPDAEGNARVMAAAPDLLEALDGYDQAVRVAIQMLNRSGHPSAQEIGDELRAKLGHACDVIARARGEA